MPNVPSTQSERRGDMAPVTVMASDGPVIVWHTPEEYAALWQGVDAEAGEALQDDDG